MKVEELRIGNYINWEQTTHVVSGLPSVNMVRSYWVKDNIVQNEEEYQGFIEEAKPIPLDDEIMERLGFNSKWTKGVFGVATTSEHSDYVFYQECKENGIAYFPKPLKYVHELQNMYYALTGEELTINEI